MPGPVFNVKIYAKHNDASTRSWTLPLWFLSGKSASVMMVVGDYPVVLNKRIADELKIKDGDDINFDIFEYGEEYTFPVKVVDLTKVDFLINGASQLGLITSSRGEKITSPVTGAELRLPEQDMFAGMWIVEKRGTCNLYFDGGCRNNPGGPAGWGFHITAENGDWLVKGCGYNASGNHSSNFMEYTGLIQGMIWAKRLDTENLNVLGDSELIINQISETYNIRNPKLRERRDAFQSLVEKSEEEGSNISMKWIPRENNSIEDKLVNQAMDRMESKVLVNWVAFKSLKNQNEV